MAVFKFAVLLLWISMECRLEQRASIKMCARAGETVAGMIQKLRAAWGDHALSVPQIWMWFKRQSRQEHQRLQTHWEEVFQEDTEQQRSCAGAA